MLVNSFYFLNMSSLGGIYLKSKFLPIGTVVNLKNVTKDLMITGYLCMREDGTKVYDYSACFYPEGSINQNISLAFNHENIEKVLYPGFDNERFQNLNNKMLSEENNFNNRYKEIDTFDFN